MHLRRWPLITVPCHVVQWVLDIAAENRAAELAIIEAAADPLGEAGSPLHREGSLGPAIRFTWEQQSEGSTVTLFAAGEADVPLSAPADDEPLGKAIAWVERFPGPVIRSTRIWIAPDDAAIAPLLAEQPLNRDELVSVTLGGKIRIWSDFRIKKDGFGRMLVAANGADPRDLTRQMQRLQELGNYRNKALLGLPVARDVWPRLDSAEARLRALADRIGNRETRDDTLLDELSALALDLAAVSAATAFRLDATRAYGQIVEERLDQIDSRPIEGFASLADFTQRRFRPAMNTCIATSERIERLALRIGQLTSLLRARIETRIENQNAKLLRSMERSISVQVRLQQLVEGLSAVVLTYYLIGLAKYALYAVPDPPGLSDEKLVGLLVVPVLIAVWLVMRRMKKRLVGHDHP